MADSFNTTIAISYTDSDTAVTTRFINESLSEIPVGYSSGKKTLAPSGTISFTAQNYIFFVTDEEVTYKIGDGETQEESTAFMHNGEAVTILVTNPSATASVVIEYVTMTTS